MAKQKAKKPRPADFFEDEEPWAPEDPFEKEEKVAKSEEPEVFDDPPPKEAEKTDELKSDTGEQPQTQEEVKILRGAQAKAIKEKIPSEAEDFCEKIGRTMKLCASVPIDVKVERSPENAEIYFFYVRSQRTPHTRGRGSISHDAVQEYLEDPARWGAQARRLVNQALRLRHNS